MHHHNGVTFLLLAYAVAVLAGWTALDLFQRVRGREGRDRALWLGAAAFAMGGGVWAMHFIAMLGFDPGAPVHYDPLLTIASFGLAVAGTAAAFTAAARQQLGPGRIPLAGTVMGLAIASMHYVGMAAMETTATVGWHAGQVGVSVAIAIGASITALWAARRETSLPWRTVAAAILGLAVVGMHYTGMAALELRTVEVAMEAGGASPLAIAISIAAVTAGILFIALAASMADARAGLVQVLAAAGVGYWEVNLKDRSFVLSPRARELICHPADRPDGDLMNPVWLADANHVAARAVALEAAIAGEADYDVEYPIVGTDRWVQSRGSLVRSRSGRPLKLAGVVSDITDRRRAFEALETSERRQKLLINELNHRVKNTLATIQSIATLTARRSGSVEEFSRLFEARLMALSDTHNLLTASGWEQATLSDLLAKEFRPYAPEQVRLEGPDVTFEAPQALAMGMVIHEMATNAAKHGALSHPEGCVTASWSEPGDDGRITLDWAETGGPPASPPRQRGFGSRLIATSLKGDLNGSADMDYSDTGLRARLSLDPAPGRRADPAIDAALGTVPAP
ncbi:MHYT domain-containing protein [Brevundimonas subvibrioides]|uniref:histidine kinase n=1 Tax=Brevundimonas subvibrioides (strain ATCC 15264 / DSM 4735 / LMG 14903 / NBRC 16000 / CB 81) TaxID=633149 RepID=D9QJP7_BRESC|nr:MHYT domain-containing protein [Brevundimonas subvibrioides]ADK99648.1 putative PAS/PAC sensor protein [Brevundimonas subvibrioides ATCC 15264]